MPGGEGRGARGNGGGDVRGDGCAGGGWITTTAFLPALVLELVFAILLALAPDGMRGPEGGVGTLFGAFALAFLRIFALAFANRFCPLSSCSYVCPIFAKRTSSFNAVASRFR